MKHTIWIPLLILALAACRQSQPETAAGSNGNHSSDTPLPLSVGLFSPLQLTGVETAVLTEDYFLTPEKLDSVTTPAGLSAELSDDKKSLTVRIVGDIPFLSSIRIHAGQEASDMLVKAPVYVPVTLRLRDKGYQQVQIKGEMNAWDPKQANCSLVNGVWEYSFQLNPGNYQYQFVVDGKEMLDPKNPKTVSNGQGGKNSLLSLPKPDPDKLPKLLSHSAEGSTLRLTLQNPGAALVFWENTRLEVKKNTDGLIEVDIPAEASSVKRSYIRAYAQNETGVSNDVLIPLESGKVILDPALLTRSDWHAQIMYFVLVDRFNNGDPGNDEPVQDDRVLPLANYLGGDIKGITAKIRDGYFKQMNINSIWLSPITQNPLEAYQEYPEPRRWYTGYHGYWPILYNQVDHRFGANEDMKELIAVAHENGINVLLDFVAHHVHKLHPIYQKHPDWVTVFDLPDGRKNLRIWDEQRLTTWFDDFLPTLDLSKPEVIDLMSDSTLFWMEQYGLDGFRHDATKHIPIEFWRSLTRKIKEQVVVGQGRPVYQIGETYGSRDLINSYISTGLLDAQFDFNLYFDSREVLGREETSFQSLAGSLDETFRYFGHHSTMGYISGNHDQARFISLAGGGMRWEEDMREAGFAREIGVGDDVGYARLQMMHAFNLAIPGVPVIYYGDEIGIPGAGDPDCRRMMRFEGWSEQETRTKEVVDALTSMRSQRLSLIYGDTDILHVADKTLAILRSYFSEKTLAVFNKGSQPATIRLPLPEGDWKASFGGQATRQGQELVVTLPPNAFEFFTLQ